MTQTTESNPAGPVPARTVLRMRKTWVLPATLAGVMIALISLIYVGSVVNPTGHLSGLPVAVVNEDTGASVNGQHVDLGNDVVSGLSGSNEVTDRLSLRVTSLAGAQHRMDTDREYATIVIPQGFTTSVLQLYGLAPGSPSARPAVTVLTNQRAGTLGGSLATGVTEPALAQVMKQLASKLASSASAAPSSSAAVLRADPMQVTTQTYRPLPDHSALGLSAFYIALLTIMCGFLGATITNSGIDSATGFAPTEIGPKWRLKRPLAMTRRQTLLTKWAVIAVIAPLLTAIMIGVAVGALGMYAPHVLLLWLFTSFASIVVGIGTLVLFALFGSLGQLLGMLIFLYLSLASSGGTVPLQALPEPFRWAAEIEPLRQVLAGTRSIMYFGASGDAGLARGLILTGVGLVFWVLAGFAVTAWYDRKGLNRISPQVLAYVNSAIARAPHADVPSARPVGASVGAADKSDQRVPSS